jgi:hypothetical protein
VCSRGSAGLNCALSNGTSFGDNTVWQPAFSDANGWTDSGEDPTLKFVQRP